MAASDLPPAGSDQSLQDPNEQVAGLGAPLPPGAGVEAPHTSQAYGHQAGGNLAPGRLRAVAPGNASTLSVGLPSRPAGSPGEHSGAPRDDPASSRAELVWQV